MRIDFNITYSQEAAILHEYYGLYSSMDPRVSAVEHLTSVVTFSAGKGCRRREYTKEAKGLH